MAQFAYEGRNARGELVKGILEATSSGTAADQLFATGVTPISISESGAPERKARTNALRFGEPRVQLVDLMLFSRQMYTLLKAGVPVIRSLAGQQEAATNGTFAAVLKDLRENIEAGREMSVSMRRHPKVFSDFMVSLVRVGEMTGRLDEVFLRIYEFCAFEKGVREKLRAATRYPIFVVTAMIAAIFIVNIFVIPAFAKLFASFKAQLPLITRMLVGMSDFFVTFWPFILLGMVAAFFGARYYVQTPEGRYRWDRAKFRLPVVGDLIYKATLSRFARAFALSMKSGVPIIQGLSVVSAVVDNAYMTERLSQMREGIERGESVLRTAIASGIFNSVVLQMIAVGEETGEMDHLMQEIAELYEREVTVEVEGLAAKIEPILLVAMGFLVLLLALGIFLPMWELASAAKGGAR